MYNSLQHKRTIAIAMVLVIAISSLGSALTNNLFLGAADAREADVFNNTFGNNQEQVDSIGNDAASVKADSSEAHRSGTPEELFLSKLLENNATSTNVVDQNQQTNNSQQEQPRLPEVAIYAEKLAQHQQSNESTPNDNLVDMTPAGGDQNQQTASDEEPEMVEDDNTAPEKPDDNETLTPVDPCEALRYNQGNTAYYQECVKSDDGDSTNSSSDTSNNQPVISEDDERQLEAELTANGDADSSTSNNTNAPSTSSESDSSYQNTGSNYQSTPDYSYSEPEYEEPEYQEPEYQEPEYQEPQYTSNPYVSGDSITVNYNTESEYGSADINLQSDGKSTNITVTPKTTLTNVNTSNDNAVDIETIDFNNATANDIYNVPAGGGRGGANETKFASVLDSSYIAEQADDGTLDSSLAKNNIVGQANDSVFDSNLTNNYVAEQADDGKSSSSSNNNNVAGSTDDGSFDGDSKTATGGQAGDGSFGDFEKNVADGADDQDMLDDGNGTSGSTNDSNKKSDSKESDKTDSKTETKSETKTENKTTTSSSTKDDSNKTTGDTSSKPTQTTTPKTESKQPTALPQTGINEAVRGLGLALLLGSIVAYLCSKRLRYARR